MANETFVEHERGKDELSHSDKHFPVFGPFDSAISLTETDDEDDRNDEKKKHKKKKRGTGSGGGEEKEQEEEEGEEEEDKEEEEASVSYLHDDNNNDNMETKKEEEKGKEEKGKEKKEEKKGKTKKKQLKMNSIRQRDRRYYRKIIHAWENEITFQCEKVNSFYELIEEQLVKEFKQLKKKLQIAKDKMQRKRQMRRELPKDKQLSKKKVRQERIGIIQQSLDRLLEEEQDRIQDSKAPEATAILVDDKKKQLKMTNLEDVGGITDMEMTPLMSGVGDPTTSNAATEYVSLARHSSQVSNGVGSSDDTEAAFLSRAQEKKLNYSELDKTYQLQNSTYEWIDLQIHRQHAGKMDP
ncbi:hypothetical protein RFI_19538, partial [Reticulomyxa filosa]